ncbi:MULTISPECIES: sugar ABC transporter substrate-binding protein [unclassified Streptomyces]|uniref:sugar ABC transporter substrate-binding protein n=1 Tax=unclassified Streptomyces TaxID=2593676 RepID=UPI0004CBCCBD|nr:MULTISPECIES: extracellular solute-binding protein [unclassified Streptomyces]KMS84424.1 ABC transporter substrate-binding protein [Streptomyces regensis]MBG7697278.1 extracellular solute-binding protein [Streptomyces sp. MC1]
MHSSSRRLLAAAALSTAVALVGTACSSGSGSTGGKGADGGTYTVWDPYPQFDKTSAWTKLLDKCGTQAGVKIKRTGFDTSDLGNKTLLAAQQDNSPDVLVVDNPVVPTLAEAGVLTTTADTRLDTSKVDPNLLAAGQSGGKTYGTPIGANTLALYYNKKVLKEAGVDIASVKDWTSLTAALEKVKKAGKKGVTFSAIGTEEGSFQFLPWFWGAGAELARLDSPQAVSALSLWKDWLKRGYAPNSVLNNTQTTSWQEFAGGDYAFAENGTWQLANARKAGLDYGVLPIPGASGGTAAAPTGGEFVTIPVQGDTGRYATSAKLATCLTSTQNLYDTDTTLSYVAPTGEVQQRQIEANPELKPWVEAVKSAKGRTSDDLGTKYPKISEQLWKAVQSALSGSKSPKDALSSAQASVK